MPITGKTQPTVLARTRSVHVGMAGRCRRRLINEISSGSGQPFSPLHQVFSDFSGWFGLETTEEGDPQLSQTPPVLILHLPLFLHLLVYPFGMCPGSVGGQPSAPRDLAPWCRCWGWMDSMHLPLNKWGAFCACFACLLLHVSDFLPSLTCSVQHVQPASCTVQCWGLIASNEGSQLSPPEARGTGRNGNWTMVLYTPSSVMDGLQQETNQRNQKNTVSC